MKALVAVLGLLVVAPLARADVPSLVPVAVDGAALRFAAPAGWGAMLTPPSKPRLATILQLGLPCHDGKMNAEEYTVFVQLDERSSPATVIKDVYPAAKTRAIRGWTCYERSDTELMCGGHVAGLRGVVTVSLDAHSADAMRAIGGVDFAVALAGALHWKGGSPSKLPEWSSDDGWGRGDACR